MKNRKIVILVFCLLVITISAFGQRRECPLAKYNGNWAFGTTTRFYVDEPFDGIGQVEVMRPGKRTEIHEKNRKWTIDGVKIKPGEVFTKAGKFVMTIESNGYKTAYNVEVLPAVGPKKPIATVLEYPIQTEYKVGNRFYVDGIKVECRDANGKKLTVEPKDITFFTSISNTMVGAGSQCGGGYQFSTPGKKIIEVRYKYRTIGQYTINVVGDKLTPSGSKSSSASKAPKTSTSKAKVAKAKSSSLANGWYNLRTMYNYLNLDVKGSGELRKKAVNTKFYVERKGDSQVTLKMTDGKYLGVDSAIKNGVRVKAVNSPYLWHIYSENGADIYSLRPSTNNKMVVNASGKKNTDGTHITLWGYTDLDAPNNAEFRFIPVK